MSAFRKLQNNCTAEAIADARFLIRCPQGQRLGEVFGANKTYQAQTMRGEFVVNVTTLTDGAKALFQHRGQ